MNFNKILKQGQRRFVNKEHGSWDKCEHCSTRAYIFNYKDNKNINWKLCNNCVDIFVKEEE